MMRIFISVNAQVQGVFDSAPARIKNGIKDLRICVKNIHHKLNPILVSIICSNSINVSSFNAVPFQSCASTLDHSLGYFRICRDAQLHRLQKNEKTIV